ncbi:hypothetical protein [Paenibacillus kribbensis]|uniref:hypothetical protein n=1 Tax=Paenibacillus kribbensis TaxID=172713 RepID=UPI000837CAEA|nr:hypothetical protein [Paenibacillus kribbensis]
MSTTPNDKDKKRDLVSWRINKLSDSEQINDWVNAQSNVQNSLTSLVRHMIEQFGYRDITDQDIQKSLYQKPIIDELRSLLPELKLALAGVNAEPPVINETDVDPIINDAIEIAEGKPVNPSDKNDDIYKLIDKNNL